MKWNWLLYVQWRRYSQVLSGEDVVTTWILYPRLGFQGRHTGIQATLLDNTNVMNMSCIDYTINRKKITSYAVKHFFFNWVGGERRNSHHDRSLLLMFRNASIYLRPKSKSGRVVSCCSRFLGVISGQTGQRRPSKLNGRDYAILFQQNISLDRASLYPWPSFDHFRLKFSPWQIEFRGQWLHLGTTRLPFKITGSTSWYEAWGWDLTYGNRSMMRFR